MKWHISLILAASALVMLAGCTAPEAEIDNTTIDFAQSVYKHITNGGVHDDPDLPYNVDAITGATLTVEGPGVVTSIPLSVRELENRSDGLFRGIYEDSTGRFIYEGVDLYYMLHEMTSGENGILLTDSAYKVQLKGSSRALAAELTLEEITAAHQAGRPILIAYGIGTPDGETAAPFVFDANAEGEHSLGYIEALDNEDGCLRLVYDLENCRLENDYDTFANVAYIYLCEESEPGFKHTDSADPAYSSPEYTDYIVTFRGQALGAEIDLTVAQLEALVHTLPDGTLPESGIGYRSEYSLANNAYWYVNEYEGLDLYQLLCYLGMNTAEEMGRAAARTTLVTFNAADGRQSPESFSVEVLSYPDAFGFYEKNAADQGDGSYVPSNADLVNTGYPVLLAYGVNRYPYTVDRGDPGYLSGLANSGGPLRVVFGKTQYNHANGSNQVQYLSEVIVGEDRLYNTHLETADPALAALAEETLTITVNGTRGERLTDLTLTVGAVEQLVHGPDPPPRDREAAKVKQRYVLSGGESAILEGVDLYHLLMETVAIPGTVGTATFSNGTDDITIALEELFTDGANPDGGLSGLPGIALVVSAIHQGHAIECIGDDQRSQFSIGVGDSPLQPIQIEQAEQVVFVPVRGIGRDGYRIVQARSVPGDELDKFPKVDALAGAQLQHIVIRPNHQFLQGLQLTHREGVGPLVVLIAQGEDHLVVQTLAVHIAYGAAPRVDLIGADLHGYHLIQAQGPVVIPLVSHGND